MDEHPVEIIGGLLILAFMMAIFAGPLNPMTPWDLKLFSAVIWAIAIVGSIAIAVAAVVNAIESVV